MIVCLSQAAVDKQLSVRLIYSHPVFLVHFPCTQAPSNNQCKNNHIWLACFSSVEVCNAGRKPQQIYPAKRMFTES